MAEYYETKGGGPKPKDKGGLNMWKVVVYASVVVITALVLMRYYKDGPTGKYTHIPKEVQFEYVPSDFNVELDDETTLAILGNPYRYEREFNQLIYDFNLSLLKHVGNRMGLPDSLRRMITPIYKKHHPYIQRMYFDDFVALQDTSAQMYEIWYENGNKTAVEILSEVASKYTCFMVTKVFADLLKTDEGRIFVKGNRVDTPCGIAMTEGLKPMLTRLDEKAAVNDFSRSKGFMKERVERTIAELATMEVRDRKGINRQLQTKVWGMNVSSSDVEISAISVSKIGFKLDRYFDISLNEKKNLVTITLPEPEILSQEVHPKIDKLDIGWMREVEGLDLNKNIDLLRKHFRRDVRESDVMDKAKIRATELMETMFSPLLFSMNKKYKLRVKFKNMHLNFDDNLPDEEDVPEPNRIGTERNSLKTPNLRND
ncbi:MAG: hypothetical protein ACI9XO_002199 [Paraglaciecola sp.]|jgi:hypothetical protein